RYGATLCSVCLAGLRAPAEADDRFLAPDPGVVIGDALELAVAAFAYEGSLRRALASLKYGSAARVAGPLAERASTRLCDVAAVALGGVLVPVPIHPERLRERGYNQAALLAAGLARANRMPAADVLVRSRATTRQ